MLVLTRRVDEAITIGDLITVTVLDIRGTTVRLGVTAPDTLAVHRDEVRRRIDADTLADRSRQIQDAIATAHGGQELTR